MTQLRADWEALVAAMGGREVAGYAVLGGALLLALLWRVIRGPSRAGRHDGGGGVFAAGCDAGGGGGDGGGD